MEAIRQNEVLRQRIITNRREIENISRECAQKLQSNPEKINVTLTESLSVCLRQIWSIALNLNQNTNDDLISLLENLILQATSETNEKSGNTSINDDCIKLYNFIVDKTEQKPLSNPEVSCETCFNVWTLEDKKNLVVSNGQHSITIKDKNQRAWEMAANCFEILPNDAFRTNYQDRSSLEAIETFQDLNNSSLKTDNFFTPLTLDEIQQKYKLVVNPETNQTLEDYITLLIKNKQPSLEGGVTDATKCQVMGQYIQDFNLISLSQEDVETTGNIEDPIITIGPKNLLRIIDQVSNKVFIEYLSNLQ